MVEGPQSSYKEITNASEKLVVDVLIDDNMGPRDWCGACRIKCISGKSAYADKSMDYQSARSLGILVSLLENE